MKLLLMLAAAILVGTSAPVKALETAIPGKSLGGITLGTSRIQAIAAAQKKFGKSTRQKSHTYANGLVEDEWAVIGGDANNWIFEIVSASGKVVQLRTWTSAQSGQTKLSFAQLTKRYTLQKDVYAFLDPQGGGYVGFYYDDVKRGICYVGGTQDYFLLTSRPDGIIVHRRGVKALAMEDGIRGKKVTGQGAKAYANAKEAERAQKN